MNSSVIWRLAPGQRLLHRCWDGECVIYNDLSGDTHLLDDFTFDLLRLLQAMPQTALALARALEVDAPNEEQPDGQAQADADPDPDPGLHADRTPLGGTLAQLAALHLGEQQAC